MLGVDHGHLRGSFNRDTKDSKHLSPVGLRSTSNVDSKAAATPNSNQSTYQQKHDGRTWAEDHPDKVKANHQKNPAATTGKPTPAPIVKTPLSDEGDDYYDDDKNAPDKEDDYFPVEETPFPTVAKTAAPTKAPVAVVITDAPTPNDGAVEGAPAPTTLPPSASPTVGITAASSTSQSSPPTQSKVTESPNVLADNSLAPSSSPSKDTPFPTVATTEFPSVQMMGEGDDEYDDDDDGSNANLFKTPPPSPSPTVETTQSPTIKQTYNNGSDSDSGDKSNYSQMNRSGEDDEILKGIYDQLSPEEIEYLKHNEFVDEEKEAAKISIVYLLLTLVLMVFTAHQLSENPDGVYSNICRLAITVVGCAVKILVLPFRKICGLGARGYSHHLVTTNDPYSGRSSSRIELI